MATVDDLIAFEEQEVGYDRYQDPLTGTKYGRWYADVTGETWAGENDIAYCVMFQSYCFAMVGLNEPFFPSQNCDDVVNRARDAGMLVNDIQRGDLVIFDWGDGGILDHIGLVYKVDANTVYTIEGNTLNGKVAYRERTYEYIEYIVRPNYMPDFGWRYNAGIDCWWYQNLDGSYPENTWKYIDGHWYYFGANGWMLTGFHKINDVWYYLQEKRDGLRGSLWLSTDLHINQDGAIVL
jgi:hypothetical protein